VMAHHLQVDHDTFLRLVRERMGFFEKKAAAAEEYAATDNQKSV
jgi:hypothetical protein